MSFRISKTSQTYQLKTLKKKLTGAITQSGQPLNPPVYLNPFYDLCIGNCVTTSRLSGEIVTVQGGLSIKKDGGPTISSIIASNLTNPENGTWIPSNPSTLLNRYINDIKYDEVNDKWFATGFGDDNQNKSLIYSLDTVPPTTWQNIENPPFTIGECILHTSPVLFGGEETNGNTISYSEDGVTFSYSNNNPFPGGKCYTIYAKYYYKYRYEPDFRMAGGYDQDRTTTISFSNDKGINWEILPNPLDGGECRSLTYNGFLDMWIAVGYNESRTISIIYSKDGSTFEIANSPFTEAYSVTTAYDDYLGLICCGKEGLAYTTDGIDWVLITNPLPLTEIRRVGYGASSSDANFLAVGYGFDYTTNAQATMMGSIDGINWIGFYTNSTDVPSSLLQILETPLVRSYVNDQNTTTLYDSNTAVDKLRLWMGLDT